MVLELPGTPTDGSTEAQLQAAQQRLPAGDVRVAVARAIAGYTPGRPGQATIDALPGLPQDEPGGRVQPRRGRAVGRATRRTPADLRHAKQLDPYGFYGERADNALHYNMARGYPLLLPAEPAGTAPSVAELRPPSQANPGDSAAWLQLAVALEQRTGRAGDRGGAARRWRRRRRPCRRGSRWRC